MTTRSVDRYLGLLLVLQLLAAAAGTVPALYLIGQDLEQTGEWLDGLGVVFGLAVLADVAVPAALAAVALHRLRAGRRSAPRWAIAAGVVGCLAVVPFGLFTGGALLPVMVVPVLLVAVAAGDLRSEPDGADGGWGAPGGPATDTRSGGLR